MLALKDRWTQKNCFICFSFICFNESPSKTIKMLFGYPNLGCGGVNITPCLFSLNLEMVKDIGQSSGRVISDF